MTADDPTTIPQPGSIEDIWQICWSNLTTKYARFSGTATRREFWTFSFTLLVIYFAAFTLSFIPVLGVLIGICNFLLWLYTIVPSLAIGARRLHDMGHSSWWQLLLIIPIFGLIALIVMWCQPTNDHYVAPPVRQSSPWSPSSGPIQHRSLTVVPLGALR